MQCGGEIIADYLGGPIVIVGVIATVRQRWRDGSRVCVYRERERE